jgi:hypothetical protein
VLEALVDGQDHELARAAELPMHQDARKVGLRAGIVALVIVEDALNLLRDLHEVFSLARTAVSGPRSSPTGCILQLSGGRASLTKKPRSHAPFGVVG